ncbi:MAG: hypothetical protein ACOYMF_05395 [Bacteroidales bacterium]
MVLEVDDFIGVGTLVSIKNVSKDELYIILKGIENVRNGIKERPTRDNIQFLPIAENMISILDPNKKIS